jgi:hypothetical protein
VRVLRNQPRPLGSCDRSLNTRTVTPVTESDSVIGYDSTVTFRSLLRTDGTHAGCVVTSTVQRPRFEVERWGAADVVAGVRALVKKSDVEKRTLDVGQLIRDVLVLVQSAVATHRVLRGCRFRTICIRFVAIQFSFIRFS